MGALAYFWFLRYHRREGRAWLERALARTGATPTRARATALWGAGALYVDHGVDLRLALRYLEESASFFREHGEPARAAYALAMMGWHLRSLREDEAAAARWNDALALARAADDPGALALPLIHMAFPDPHGGRDAETRRRLLDEALPLAERSGDPLLLAMAYRIAGDLALQRGDLPAARAAFGVDLASTRALKETVGIWGTLVSLGRVATQEGDLAGARRYYTEARTLQRDSGAGPRMMVGTACRLAELALLEGDPAAARAGFVEALALARQAGDPGGLARPPSKGWPPSPPPPAGTAAPSPWPAPPPPSASRAAGPCPRPTGRATSAGSPPPTRPSTRAPGPRPSSPGAR